jgi:cytochrome P450
MLPALAPGPVNELEPQVRALCRRLLDNLGDHEIINGGMEYAQYIPPTVIQQLLGFPPEDEETFREFVHVIMEGVDHPEEQRVEEFAPIEEYLRAQIEDHREHPRDDFTNYLLNAEIEGNKLQDEHIAGTIILTLVAGIDTTWSAIGAALWHLASRRD